MAKYTDYVSDLLEKDYDAFEAKTLSRRAFKTRTQRQSTDSMKERAQKIIDPKKEEKINKIKERIRENGFLFCEVAYVLGMTDTHFSKWLSPVRFDDNKGRKINEAIDLLIEAIKNSNEGSDEE